eukprot:CAMPEP_0118952718 /NCGR_PEP_ID=MMETSP1169-20130426/55349_1 /TAXON_ID=36882 /ORGANISM="Pyramimonas obovata, Strain CCMP722" /LENGTH=114 /DNA_ID=CAMNT_0006900037 /DNA_START=95 /DNA_END=436 /DNA_ORIENTATION=-
MPTAGRSAARAVSDTDSEVGATFQTGVSTALRPGAPRQAWGSQNRPPSSDSNHALNLEMENKRLKKELTAQEDKLKHLHARLARTEEAAKRAMVGASEVGSRAHGAPNTARLFQ